MLSMSSRLLFLSSKTIFSYMNIRKDEVSCDKTELFFAWMMWLNFKYLHIVNNVFIKQLVASQIGIFPSLKKINQFSSVTWTKALKICAMSPMLSNWINFWVTTWERFQDKLGSIQKFLSQLDNGQTYTHLALRRIRLNLIYYT
jgi:hypothetical protein